MTSTLQTLIPTSYPALEAEAYLACESAEERQTGVDELAPPTCPILSRNRHEGMLWSERMMRQARTCAGDAARFAAKLGC